MKMRGIADLLAAAGQHISDDDLALQILAGFGMEYDAVVVNFTKVTVYFLFKTQSILHTPIHSVITLVLLFLLLV